MKKITEFSGDTEFPWLKKLFRIMKLTTFLILISVVCVFASETYSQTKKLNLNMKNATVKEVLSAIEDQSEFKFMYSAKVIDVNREVAISEENSKIEDALKSLFAGTDVNYTIKDRIIVLSSGALNNNELTSIQQPKSVSGKVTDSSGSPLPGVSIVVKGTTTGIITDANGNYTVQNVPVNATLLFSFVGMKEQEIQVGEQAIIDVSLNESVTGLDEVIVVGYGTKKKRDITGSIATVAGEDLAQSKSESFGQALQGRTAGVYVMSNSGRPGGGVSIRIRGVGGINNSEPLYIIDGVQIPGSSSATSNPLASINTSDIESLEVLKDASSAAIYGARGANGVVIITTNRGKKEKMKLTYSTDFGIQNFAKNNVEFLNAQQFAERANKMYADAGKPVPFGGTDTNTYPVAYFPSPSQLGEGTNWMDEMTVKNAPVQNHQIAISGGNENHNIYLSLNYFDQDGILLTSGFKRYSIRLNTDNILNKWLTVGNSLSVSNTDLIGNSDIASPGGESNISQMYRYAPTIPVYNADGSFAGPPTNFYGPSRNPYAAWATTERSTKNLNVLGNFYAKVQLMKELSFKSSVSVDLGHENFSQYIPIYYEGIVTSGVTSVSYNTGKAYTWIWNNVLTFDKQVKKHHVSALAGTEAIRSKYNDLTSSAAFTDNSIKIVKATGATTSNFSQFLSAYSLVSYFGNLSYNYDQKYYLEGNIRRDGSSRFGINTRWGLFPSGSVAWRISKESFFPKTTVDDLKFRASYGMVGNDKIGNFRYIVPLSTTLYSLSGKNSDFAIGQMINNLANPGLKWETSKQFNVGLDMTLLDNKMTFSADYFKTDVSDMLLGLTVPDITGTPGSITTNAGSLTNKGFEFEVSYRDQIGEIRYGANANLTTYNNVVTDIGTNVQLWGQMFLKNGDIISRTVVGGSLGEFYGYISEGIFQTQAEVDAANALGSDGNATPYQAARTAPGDFKWKDIDGDGKVSLDKDRTVIGNPIPDFTYGFGLELGYKNFDMSAMFNGIQGRDIYNGIRSHLEGSGYVNSNHSTAVLNAWNGPETSNTIARAVFDDPNRNGNTVSSLYVEDGSFLRLKNMQLSYTIPKNIISTLKIAKAQVYLSGENLITFTKYKGYDPEVGNALASNLSSGIELEIYPQAKSFHIGARITF